MRVFICGVRMGSSGYDAQYKKIQRICSILHKQDMFIFMGTRKAPSMCCPKRDKYIISDILSIIPDNQVIVNAEHGTDSMTVFNKSHFICTPQGCFIRIQENIVFIHLGNYPSLESLKYMDLVRAETKDFYVYIVMFDKSMDSSEWTLDEKNRFVVYLDNICTDKIMCIIVNDDSAYVNVLRTDKHSIPILSVYNQSKSFILTIENKAVHPDKPYENTPYIKTITYF